MNVSVPAHRVVTLELPPATSTMLVPQQDGIAGLRIRTTTGGFIINYAAERKTPIRLSLYGLDGKEIAASAALTIEPGNQNITWRSKAGFFIGHSYIVKASIDNMTISR